MIYESFKNTPINRNPSEVNDSRLTKEAADLLRRYKRRVLDALDLKEAMFCDRCDERGTIDGTRTEVTDGTISIACRCRSRTYKGQSY